MLKFYFYNPSASVLLLYHCGCCGKKIVLDQALTLCIFPEMAPSEKWWLCSHLLQWGFLWHKNNSGVNENLCCVAELNSNSTISPHIQLPWTTKEVQCHPGMKVGQQVCDCFSINLPMPSNVYNYVSMATANHRNAYTKTEISTRMFWGKRGDMWLSLS